MAYALYFVILFAFLLGLYYWLKNRNGNES
jgi:hypothetical protein